jgi:ATP-binding cassette subfamily B protein
LDKGRILQKGTHDELVTQDGIYRQIFDIQTRIETELEQEINQATAPVPTEILKPEPVLAR